MRSKHPRRPQRLPRVFVWLLALTLLQCSDDSSGDASSSAGDACAAAGCIDALALDALAAPDTATATVALPVCLQDSDCAGLPAPACHRARCATDGLSCLLQQDIDKSPCSDGDACTISERCQAGNCVAGVAVSCDDGNACTEDACDPPGGCTITFSASACDDGDACTAPDRCTQGACIPSALVFCDDGDPCTDDTCLIASGCTVTVNALPCDDDDACTVGDVCLGGDCQAGSAVTCEDGNGCTDNACDVALGCTATANELPCDDGDACTAADSCGGGHCLPGTAVSCDDANPCTDDACLPASGCTLTANAHACDDGDACTTGDGCHSGACSPDKTVICDDGNGCTDDACDPATGCTVTANKASCSDNNACTGGDGCLAGACKAGKQSTCDDNNGCTSDTCDMAVGCTSTNNQSPCSDGDACTKADQCADGACLPGPVTACDDANPCTDDSCHKAMGCLHVLAVSVCDDGNICTIDACSLPAGCTHTAAPASQLCSDGNPCTWGEHCSAGKCGGGAPTSPACCAAGGGQAKDGHCFWVDPSGRKMTLVPAGKFWMGCNPTKDKSKSCEAGSKAEFVEAPQHEVALSAYWIDVHEVIVADYLVCQQAGVCTPRVGETATELQGAYQFDIFGWFEDKLFEPILVPLDVMCSGIKVDPKGNAPHPQWPVNCVRWNDARGHCNWRNAELPNEAQWEKAARGGCEHNGGAAQCKSLMRTWPWGEEIASCARALMRLPDTVPPPGKSIQSFYTHYSCAMEWWNSGGLPEAPGSKPAGASPCGAHDLAGNLREWTLDSYTPDFYAKSPKFNPVNFAPDKPKVTRGGGLASFADDLRSSARRPFDPSLASATIGFRCVRPAGPPTP